MKKQKAHLGELLNEARKKRESDEIERDFDAFSLAPCFVQMKPEGYLDFGIFLIF